MDGIPADLDLQVLTPICDARKVFLSEVRCRGEFINEMFKSRLNCCLSSSTAICPNLMNASVWSAKQRNAVCWISAAVPTMAVILQIVSLVIVPLNICAVLIRKLLRTVRHNIYIRKTSETPSSRKNI